MGKGGKRAETGGSDGSPEVAVSSHFQKVDRTYDARHTAERLAAAVLAGRAGPTPELGRAWLAATAGTVAVRLAAGEAVDERELSEFCALVVAGKAEAK